MVVNLARSTGVLGAARSSGSPDCVHLTEVDQDKIELRIGDEVKSGLGHLSIGHGILTSSVKAGIDCVGWQQCPPSFKTGDGRPQSGLLSSSQQVIRSNGAKGCVLNFHNRRVIQFGPGAGQQRGPGRQRVGRGLADHRR